MSKLSLKIAIYLLLNTIIICSCSDESPVIDEGTPPCISELIQSFIKNDSTCPGSARVSEYELEGELLYAFFHGDCVYDSSTEIYDQNCNFIGSLGGFAGQTSINGIDFSTANLVRVVWQ